MRQRSGATAFLTTMLALCMTCLQGYCAPVTVTTGKVEGAPGKEVHVPIMLKGAKDAKGVSCMSIRLTYDPALLTFKSIEKGPVLPNAIFDKSVDEKADPGLIGLGFACGSKTPDSKEMASVTDDGVVLTVNFTVNDKASAGAKSPLKLDNYRVLDTADPPFELQVVSEPGEFTVVGGLPLLWILIAAGVGLLLLILIILLATRRRDRRPQMMSAMPVGQMPMATPAGVLPRFTPEAPTFSHTCTKCGGVIQMPRAMAGQPFQCGACGTPQVATPS